MSNIVFDLSRNGHSLQGSWHPCKRKVRSNKSFQCWEIQLGECCVSYKFLFVRNISKSSYKVTYTWFYRGGGYITNITKFTTELTKLHPTRPTHSHLIQFACFTGTHDVVWTVLAHCHQQSCKLSMKSRGFFLACN